MFLGPNNDFSGSTTDPLGFIALWLTRMRLGDQGGCTLDSPHHWGMEAAGTRADALTSRRMKVRLVGHSHCPCWEFFLSHLALDC